MSSALSDGVRLSSNTLLSFRQVMPSCPNELFDLRRYRLNIVLHSRVGEPENGVAIQLQLHVTDPIGVVPLGPAMLQPVQLHYHALGRPQEVGPNRTPHQSRLIDPVPDPADSPLLIR